MNRTAYYEELKTRAREIRTLYGVTTEQLGLQKILAIYRQEGIKVDYWKHKLRKVRGAYIFNDGKAQVLLNANIKPIPPKLFTLAHELKHHYMDQEAAEKQILRCLEAYASRNPIEIGAEVFAAEFIFPEDEFRSWADALVSRRPYTQEDVVTLKRGTSAHVSYQFLVKRLEWLGYVAPGTFAKVRFQKLEDSIYGIPFYRRRRS